MKLKTNDFKDINEGNVIEFIDFIIRNAIEEKVSDIHIDSGFENILIRYRIDGDLFTFMEFPKKCESIIFTRVKILAGMDIAQKRISQDGRIDFYFEERKVDLRISTLPLITGEKVVIRILDSVNLKIDFENLGFFEEDLPVVRKLISKNTGVLIICGPTGCGKSTTLNSILNEIKSEKENLITIENPVELKIKGANQIQVNEKAGITFSKMLRAVLRNDPDYIMIGEMRDSETAEIAIRSAITGHKVFSTLHNRDNYSAVARLIDMGIKPYLISCALGGVITQRLIKKLCDKCKKKVQISDKDRLFINQFADLGTDYIYEPVGCDCCNNGYLGRMPVFEILEIDENIISIINNDFRVSTLRDYGENQLKVKTMFQKAVIQAINGNTSLEEVRKLLGAR